MLFDFLHTLFVCPSGLAGDLLSVARVSILVWVTACAVILAIDRRVRAVEELALFPPSGPESGHALAGNDLTEAEWTAYRRRAAALRQAL